MKKNSHPPYSTAGEVRRSIRAFRDIADDLVHADWPTFGDRVIQFTNFCRTDRVFSKIHKQLESHPKVDGNEWLKSNNARLSGLRFPVDPDQRLSLQYQLVIAGAENPLALMNRVMWSLCESGDLSNGVHAFAEAVMRPLFRELEYRLAEIEENLPEAKTEVVNPSALQIIHIRTESVVMQRNQFNRSKNIQFGNQNVQDNREVNLSLTLKEIIHQIDSSNTSDSQKKEAKTRLGKFLEHPLVSAIVGGATSALLTAR
jgi:hypothetical protein